MKKLYRKGSVHPSPPLVSDPLAFLPAAILTLSAALSPEDRQVLAYLISCSSSSFSSNRSKSTSAAAAATARTGSSSGDHAPSFSCNCFRCYTSYWVRWDSSPNRQLIHEIIDALEDDLAQTQLGKGGSKKERRKRGPKVSDESKRSSEILIQGKEESSVKPELPTEEVVSEGGLSEEISGGDSVIEAEEMEKGSVRKIVSFIGERFWNIWT
ncbi:uncharacterized protein LOC124914418 [Impatiens glandulifera]|uniref:uncharacterized protein LOC124914418 n=1 Tax=Impatiens glandulifera TaxID=253017 RepID=UPI001FB0E317|nr:uncharacterized protein LOC124914418 [Impatiens glandulifera]